MEQSNEDKASTEVDDEVPAPPAGHVRPIVFFDISIGEAQVGRIKMELFDDIVPLTAENFRMFCTGEYDPKKGYKNCLFHRVIPDFVVQSGDFVSGDGRGVSSIYNDRQFEDENFQVKHSTYGLLSMANSGKDANGCQFFITCKESHFLDGKHVVFGRVIDGMLVVRKIENTPLFKEKPRLPVKITECGEM